MTVFELVDALNENITNIHPSMQARVFSSTTVVLSVGQDLDDVASLTVGSDGSVKSIVMRQRATIEHLRRIKRAAPDVEVKGV